MFAGDSTDVLTFKCGGSQHVNEVCGKTFVLKGGFEHSPHSELESVQALLREAERRGLPAPGPVEQRFSGRSGALLSPCSDNGDEGAVFMWMNNILYRVRRDVDDLWPAYADLLREVGARFGAVPVWCKLDKRCQKTAAMLENRYDLREFERVRSKYDPEQVLGENPWAPVTPSSNL